MKLANGIFLAILSLDVAAQTKGPPPIVFFDEKIMSEKRALELGEFTRAQFWDNARGFDGKSVIKPKDEVERASIPIPRWTLLHIADFSSFAAELNRCHLDGVGFSKQRMKELLRTFADEKQAQFAFGYSYVVMHDVSARRSSVVCGEKEAERFRKIIETLFPTGLTNQSSGAAEAAH